MLLGNIQSIGNQSFICVQSPHNIFTAKLYKSLKSGSDFIEYVDLKVKLTKKMTFIKLGRLQKISHLKW